MSEIGEPEMRAQQDQGPRIGVQALLAAGDGPPRPQVALQIPGVAHRVRLSEREAAELGVRLLGAVQLAGYEAAIYAELAEMAACSAERRASSIDQAAVLEVLVRARERMQRQP